MQTSNSSYSNFLKTPYHRESPLFSNQKLNVDTGKEKVTLYLDITKRDVVNEMYYEIEGEEFWSPFFSFLCFFCEGKTLDELLLLDNEIFKSWESEDVKLPFISLPLLMLTKLIYRYKGEAPSYAEIAGESQDTLYCRCFGVYESQLVNILLDHPDKDINYFSDQTRAATGCSSCTKDIKNLIQRVRDRLGMSPNNDSYQRSRPLGKTPSEFSLFLSEELKLLSEKNIISSELGLELIDYKEYNPTLFCLKESETEGTKRILEEYFFEKYEIKLCFNFSF
jgi:NifU-like protein